MPRVPGWLLFERPELWVRQGGNSPRGPLESVEPSRRPSLWLLPLHLPTVRTAFSLFANRERGWRPGAAVLAQRAPCRHHAGAVCPRLGPGEDGAGRSCAAARHSAREPGRDLLEHRPAASQPALSSCFVDQEQTKVSSGWKWLGGGRKSQSRQATTSMASVGCLPPPSPLPPSPAP